jgi:hypothetical protein
MRTMFLIYSPHMLIICHTLTGKKKRLLEIFGGWCDIVVDLINATEEDAILRRDIYDRPPIMNWGRGRVTLLFN